MPSFTPPLRLATEALVIAVVFAALFGVTHVISMQFLDEDAMTNHIALLLQAAFAAALFHVAFEYSGLNERYCKKRSKIIT